MPDTLYDTDIVVWAEQQADLLRRLAAGERVNAAVDWANLIEEVETVGRPEWTSVERYLQHALTHLLKLRFNPGTLAQAHWREEIMNFVEGAQRRWAPSMRQRVKLIALYKRAARRLEGLTVPPFPYTLDDLLDPDYDVDTLLAKLG